MRKIDEDVCKVLRDIGFDEEEIEKAFNINENLKYVLDTDVQKVIEFLKQYKLTEKEIAEISKNNPWLLTENFQRMRILEEYYKKIGIEEINELLKKYPIAMSINPAKLKQFIEDKLEAGIESSEVKQILMNQYDKYFKLGQI